MGQTRGTDLRTSSTPNCRLRPSRSCGVRARLAAPRRCAEEPTLTMTCDRKHATPGAAFCAAPITCRLNTHPAHRRERPRSAPEDMCSARLKGRSRLCAGCEPLWKEEGRLTATKSAVASCAMSADKCAFLSDQNPFMIARMYVPKSCAMSPRRRARRRGGDQAAPYARSRSANSFRPRDTARSTSVRPSLSRALRSTSCATSRRIISRSVGASGFR